MARAWRQNDKNIGRKRVQGRLYAPSAGCLQQPLRTCFASEFSFEIEVILTSCGLAQLAANLLRKFGQRHESLKMLQHFHHLRSLHTASLGPIQPTTLRAIKRS